MLQWNRFGGVSHLDNVCFVLYLLESKLFSLHSHNPVVRLAWQHFQNLFHLWLSFTYDSWPISRPGKRSTSRDFPGRQIGRANGPDRVNTEHFIKKTLHLFQNLTRSPRIKPSPRRRHREMSHGLAAAGVPQLRTRSLLKPPPLPLTAEPASLHPPLPSALLQAAGPPPACPKRESRE